MKVRILISTILFLFSVNSAQSITGFVRDHSNGEPLSYANVFLQGTNIGAATNMDGYFVIPNVSSGNYDLVASMIGFEMQAISIIVVDEENIRKDFRLSATSLMSQEVIVTAERQQFRKQVEPSRIQLNMRDIERLPSFVEPDIFRILKLLPGVQTMNDFSSALYVRGSTPDQNLIMMDGITVYNPFHLGGIFSTFNTDAIKEADFHAGGFPARYGGRMGSILNIINREGNTEKVSGRANISMISSKGMIEGPLPGKIKGSWMLAGRRTYFDLFTKLGTYIAKKKYADEMEGAPDNFFPYHFYDIEGKVNLDLTNNHRLTFSTFIGDDIYDMSFENTYQNDLWDGGYRESNETFSFDWKWGNQTNSLTWRWLISPKMVLKTFVASSRFHFWIDLDSHEWGEMKYDYSEESNWDNTFYFDAFDIVDDKSLETEFTYTPNDKHTITSGFQVKDIGFNLGLILGESWLGEDFATLSMKDTVLWMDQTTRELGLYLQDKWRISTNVSAQLGLRLSTASAHEGLFRDPRFGLKYLLDNDTSIKFNWGRYHQFMTIANPQDENLRFIDIWMAIPEDNKIPFSDHTILGIEHLNSKNILYRLEAYYKSFDNLITLKQGNIFSEGDDGIVQFSPFNDFYDTDAYAYGLEGFIQKKTGKVSGWAAYTYAVTRWKTELHDWYAPKFDRPHTINLVGDWQWTEKTHVGLTLSYATGNPYTEVQGRIQNWDESYWGNSSRFNWWKRNGVLVGEKNGARFPDYFRIDVNFTKRKVLKKGGFREWYFQIINVTNHLNALMYIYDTEYDEQTGDAKGMRRAGLPMFPIFPTFGLRIQF
ncbi:MAG: TonB-dependent receptor [Candidatus Marinimicrobia bacterium]|nr:TonB-dependent receptor [Candidatus Neomarinimicrobiota bacterium]